jgi:hypothetical protein
LNIHLFEDSENIPIQFFCHRKLKITHKDLNPEKPEITSTRLQINLNIQISNKIKNQLFGILNLGHCDLPFDWAQGGELVEPFGICDLAFEIF